MNPGMQMDVLTPIAIPAAVMHNDDSAATVIDSYDKRHRGEQPFEKRTVI
jgi:hypothetical protein